MNMSPAAAPNKHTTRKQPEVRRAQHDTPFEFRAFQAPDGLGALPGRLDEVTFRRVAYEERQSPHNRPSHDAQGDHRRRHSLLDRSRGGGGLKNPEQPRGEWCQDYGSEAEARDDDAGDQPGASGGEPLDRGRRRGAITEPYSAAGDHAEADHIGDQ